MTISCTSNGTGISWESSPPLGEYNQSTIHSFVKADGAGNYSCYARNYTCGTAFFVSIVLEDVGDDDCNSSITFIPIPNNDGLFPTYYTNRFTIGCTTEDDSGKVWQFRVAGIWS